MSTPTLPTVSTKPIHAPDADRLHERLAEILEDLNAETCPALRVELHLDAQDLRDQLRVAERQGVSAR